MSIEQVRVLHGHTDQHTAYQVYDQPYNFRHRCSVRYWIETVTTGPREGHQRFVRQTTNPRRDGVVWNKPKPATYVSLAVLYLDPEDNVAWAGVRGSFITPHEVAWWRLCGITAQLRDDVRHRYEHHITAARQTNPEPWDRFDSLVDAIAGHMEASGEDPVIDGGMWSSPSGLHHVGRHSALLLATARERLDAQPCTNHDSERKNRP